jgi:hypothetical protein
MNKASTTRKVPGKGKLSGTPVEKNGINESNTVIEKIASPAKFTRSQTSTQDSPQGAAPTRARKGGNDGSVSPDPAQKGAKKSKAVNALDFDASTESQKGDDADSTILRGLDTGAAAGVLCANPLESITGDSASSSSTSIPAAMIVGWEANTLNGEDSFCALPIDKQRISEAVNMHEFGEHIQNVSLRHIASLLPDFPLTNGFSSLAELMDWRRCNRTFEVTLALESAYLERKIERDQCLRELVEKCNLLVIFKRKHVRSPQLSEESISTQMLEISSKYLTSADATSLQICVDGNETLASRVLSERAQEGHISSVAADSAQGLLKKLRSARRQIIDSSQYLLNKCLLLKVIFSVLILGHMYTRIQMFMFTASFPVTHCAIRSTWTRQRKELIHSLLLMK